MSAPAKDSRGDQGPGWTPQTSSDAPESCSTCLRTAAGYKGPLHECGACYEYRRQHGTPRPQRLIDRADERRYERAARQAELDKLRANQFRNDILLDSHTDRTRKDYPDGINRPTTSPNE